MSIPQTTDSTAAADPMQPAPLVFSSADCLSVDLTVGHRTTDFGPVARVSGGAPPPYDTTRHIRHLHKTLDLKPSNPLHPTLHLDEKNVETNASSNGISLDSTSSQADTTIGSSDFLLFDNPVDILGVVGLSFSATDIRSSADFSHVFGSSRNFVTGDASFGSLRISGTLIGRTLTFSGDAAPNTVLYSSPTVTITLDKQVVTDLVSIGPTLTVNPVSITTDAIDIHLNHASLFGKTISGDIIIGQSSAGTTHLLVPGQLVTS